MRIYTGEFPVCYGQFYFLSESDWDGDLNACFLNQNNGLCGVSREGVVFFVTGLHTGKISLTVELLRSAPELLIENDEIVEASFSVRNHGLALESWGGEVKIPLNLAPGNYIIRYSAKNFGAAEISGKFEDASIELYTVEIWPGQLTEDKIVKATSEPALYWHREITQLK